MISKLNAENMVKIGALSGRKDTVIKLFNYVTRNPIIDIVKTSEALELQYNTVAKAVEKLVSLKILEQVNSFKRNRRFVYFEHLNALRKDTQL